MKKTKKIDLTAQLHQFQLTQGAAFSSTLSTINRSTPNMLHAALFEGSWMGTILALQDPSALSWSLERSVLDGSRAFDILAAAPINKDLPYHSAVTHFIFQSARTHAPDFLIPQERPLLTQSFQRYNRNAHSSPFCSIGYQFPFSPPDPSVFDLICEGWSDLALLQVSTLLHQSKPLTPDELGRAAYLCCTRAPLSLQYFLEQGADPNFKAPWLNQESLLHHAYSPCLDILLSAGADPEAVDAQGCRVLDAHAKRGALSEIRLVMAATEPQAQSNPDSQPRTNSPLFYALAASKADAFRQLLRKGEFNLHTLDSTSRSLFDALADQCLWSDFLRLAEKGAPLNLYGANDCCGWMRLFDPPPTLGVNKEIKNRTAVLDRLDELNLVDYTVTNSKGLPAVYALFGRSYCLPWPELFERACAHGFQPTPTQHGQFLHVLTESLTKSKGRPFSSSGLHLLQTPSDGFQQFFLNTLKSALLTPTDTSALFDSLLRAAFHNTTYPEERRCALALLDQCELLFPNDSPTYTSLPHFLTCTGTTYLEARLKNLALGFFSRVEARQLQAMTSHAPQLKRISL